MLEGGEIVVSHLVRDDFEAVGATEPYSEGIIDVLRSVEGSLVSALIREPPREGGPARKVSLRSSVDEIDVSAIARKSQGGGHRAAAGFSSDLSVEELTEFIVREVAAQVGSAASLGSAASRAPSERDHPRRQARRPDVVRDRRRDAPADEGANRPRGHARSVRDRAAAAPLGCLDAAPAAVRRPAEALRDGDRPHGAHVDRRHRGRAYRGARCSRADELEAALDGLRGAVDLPIPAVSAVKIDGERAYALHRRGVAVEMPVRTMHVHELDARGVRGRCRAARPARLVGDVHPRDRRRARRPLRRAARTEIGPFHVDEADPERMIPPEEALARLA